MMKFLENIDNNKENNKNQLKRKNPEDYKSKKHQNDFDCEK